MIPHKAVLLDLDGTVYRGSQPVPHAAEVIHELISQGKQVRYLTNNSAARPDTITTKLTAMGIPCEPKWVYSSGQIAAEYCRSHDLKTVFLVGEPSLAETFLEAGISATGHNPDAVVVGICRTFTYSLMDQAMQHILNGSTFIATNTDFTYPLEEGKFSPGAGSIVASIQACSGTEPLIMGKPGPTMPLQICADLHLQPSDALIVGDRLNTDIACGIAAGCDTWLVLTGVETQLPSNQPGSPDLRGLL